VVGWPNGELALKFGVFLPISGRAASAVLTDAVRRAEGLGYDSVWAADRIITPWEINTPYPYSGDQRFIVPPDSPFLEPLTCLAFLAGCTEKVSLGMSVLVMPYRHPLYCPKIAATIDHLSKGRLILGVGVGWMVEEFDALGASFTDRGAVADEQLQVIGRAGRKRSPSSRDATTASERWAFPPSPFSSRESPSG